MKKIICSHWMNLKVQRERIGKKSLLAERLSVERHKQCWRKWIENYLRRLWLIAWSVIPQVKPEEKLVGVTRISQVAQKSHMPIVVHWLDIWSSEGIPHALDLITFFVVEFVNRWLCVSSITFLLFNRLINRKQMATLIVCWSIVVLCLSSIEKIAGGHLKPVQHPTLTGATTRLTRLECWKATWRVSYSKMAWTVWVLNQDTIKWFRLWLELLLFMS